MVLCLLLIALGVFFGGGILFFVPIIKDCDNLTRQAIQAQASIYLFQIHGYYIVLHHTIYSEKH